MSATVVVDASLAVKWALAEPYSSQAEQLLQEWQQDATRILAPGLLAYEVANAFFQRARRGDISPDDAARGLATILAIGPELDHDPEAHARAMSLAQQFSRPTPYDAHYLALAERENCELWTADERLWNLVRNSLSWVRWIGERPATDDEISVDSVPTVTDDRTSNL